MGKVQGRNSNVGEALARKIVSQLTDVVTMLVLILGPEESIKTLREMTDALEEDLKKL